MLILPAEATFVAGACNLLGNVIVTKLLGRLDSLVNKVNALVNTLVGSVDYGYGSE